MELEAVAVVAVPAVILATLPEDAALIGSGLISTLG
jgi:hypothetical protein